MLGPTSAVAGIRSRHPIAAVGLAPPPPHVPADPAGSEASASADELSSREDVERILNEKMKGKSKCDYKGKSEQMIEYIRKLRTCIRWLIERDDVNLAEIESSRNLLESEEKRRAESEAQMSSSIEELNATIEEQRREYAVIQESFRKEEAEKHAAIKSYEVEKEGRLAVERLRDTLAEDLAKADQEEKRLNDQIKGLEETNKRVLEYNTSLQQFSSTLQAEASKNHETISKLNEEKNTMKESLTALRNNMTSMKNQLDTSKAEALKNHETISKLNGEKNTMEESLTALRNNITSLKDQLDTSRRESDKHEEDLQKEIGCLRSDLQQVRDDRDHQLAQAQSLVAEVANYKELTGNSAMEFEKVTIRANALEDTCTSQSGKIHTLQRELAAAKEKLKIADLTTMKMMSEYEVQKNTIDELQRHLADAEYQLIEAEKLRKELHNTILELKGNIRVFCRVRPNLAENDCNSREEVVVSYPISTELRGRGVELMHNAKHIAFTFDKVFIPEASQEDVFVEISQLVQSALDGYRVCIFAYGQTGSGKTYTMMGTTEHRGLIPRSLEQIFETGQSKLSQGWKYKMQASILEIYNETIRDLLSRNPSVTLDIKHDVAGNAYVPGLTVMDVCSIKEVSFLLQRAAQSRSVGWTQMNEQSSRSHFVFTLRISGVNENTGQQIQGVLNLIDLAGSERLSKSGSTGDRLKETQAINKSLSALRDVIVAIANKKDHVPFRNSKLTHILQSSLGRDSKTLMFVNISPEATSSGESFCSLQFATGVNSCELGVPRRQSQMRSSESRLSYG